MYNDIVKRLLSLGYTVETSDNWIIKYLIKEVTQTIINECNTPEVPEGLYYVAVNMVCGEFLLAKQASGQLNETSINTEAAIKQIKEGDTSITYAVGDTAGSSFDGLIDILRNSGRSQFITYRRILW